MQNATVKTCSFVSQRFILRGLVQGQGVRPTVARFAEHYRITGDVRNTTSGVQIDAFGSPDSMSQFSNRLRMQFHVSCVELPIDSPPPTQFLIRSSLTGDPFCTLVPPDLVVCKACIKDIQEPRSRRFRYPLTSCVACGPRYSIIKKMPYDREETSMDGFALCERCQDEYTNPSDRRFHAQTNSCPDCGPRYRATDSAGRQVHGTESISHVVDLLTSGGVAAIKGVGGYQLMCDATNDSSVKRLRGIKRRPAKPLPIMVLDAHQASRYATVSHGEKDALESPAAPIVLLAQKSGTRLSESLNPHLLEIGIMVPTSPLHWMICEQANRPIVVTSANLSGNPMVYQNDAATRELSDVVDVMFHHDREIVRPVDDSVVRVIDGRTMTIRAGRGIAPLTLPNPAAVDDDVVSEFGVGAHQKVAVSVSTSKHFVLGPHIGDMESEICRARFAQQLESIGQLHNCTLKSVARDFHPDYFTSRFPSAETSEVVQHHHAHIAAAMLEHDLLDQTVLGFSFDGTGLGTDGCVWGGEIMICDGCDFERIAHLRPFQLLGGDRAIREPWRLALSVISQSCPDKIDSCWVPRESDRSVLLRFSSASVWTTSMGRLFDAVAAMVLGIRECRYEGEAAMNFEAICDESEDSSYSFEWQRSDLCGAGKPAVVDWKSLIESIVTDRDRISKPRIAMKFHRAVADLIIEVSDVHRSLPVVVTGGVFQNRVLLNCVAERAKERGIDLRLPGLIPVNDGGISMGQLVVAHQRRQKSEVNRCV